MKNPVETILVVSTNKIKNCIADGRIEEARIINKFTSELLHEFEETGPIITTSQCKKEDRFHVGDYITTDIEYQTSIGTVVVNTQEHLNKIGNLFKIVYTDLEYVKLVVIKANAIGYKKNVTFTRPIESIYTCAKKVSVGYPILYEIYPKIGDYITTDTNYELPSLNTGAEFSCIQSLYRITYISGSLAVTEVIKHRDEEIYTLIIDLNTVKALPLSDCVEAMATAAIIRHRGF